MSELQHPAESGWLKRFFAALAVLALLGALLLLPWSVCWLTAGGELDQDEVVARQAGGGFVLYGPGLPLDMPAYKLALYAAVKPGLVVLGSSRVGNLRAACFEASFVNMAGAATDLDSLCLLVDRMLAIHRPRAVLLGLDFWWLTATPPGQPPARPCARPSLLDAGTLRAPWLWLWQGRLAPADMLLPLRGGLRDDRYGLEAQLRDTGYGPDGSFYAGAVLDGRLPAPDHAFARTLRELEAGGGIWAGGLAPDRERLEAFAEICCRLRARGIRTVVFLPPLATPVLEALAGKNGGAAWLEPLRQGLLERGVEVMDFSDPRVYGSGDCELMDGLHGGDVIAASMVRDMGDRQPWLRDMLHKGYLSHVLRERRGLAAVPDERLTALPETDFLGLHCARKRRADDAPRP